MTPTIENIDANVPHTETTENAAAQIGTERIITAIVVGGLNLEGNDLILFSLSLAISI